MAISDLHGVKERRDSDGGDGRGFDIAKRQDVTDLRKRMERSGRPVSVVWVERIVARAEALDAPLGVD